MSIQAQHFESVEAATVAASEKLWTELKAALESSQPVLLLLAGGSATKIYTQVLTHISSPEAKTLPWKNVSIALEDERWPNKSNETDILKTNLLQTLQSLGAQYFGLPTDQTQMAASAVMAAWLSPKLLDKTTKRIGVIGIGADGHTLSVNVDPNQAHFFTTFETQALVTAYHSVATTAQFPVFPDRITLTLTGLQHLDVAIGLVAGTDKAEMLKKLQTETISANIMPAQALKKIPTYLFIT